MTDYQQLSDDQREALLDRLVDGELSSDERRGLLRSLDATPDAWRACALAFVEAQVLREQLTAVASEKAEPLVAAVDREPTPRSSASVWLAIAASTVVAFGLGMFAKQLSAPDAVEPLIADHDVPQVDSPSDPQMAAVANADPAPAARDLNESVTFWVMDREGQRRSLTAPLVDAAEIDNRFGFEFPTSVTPDMRQRLEGQGYRLSTRRRYAPLYTNSGRPLVVPVEDVQIFPVKGTEL